jgi:carbon monoxide dehydrogenase subunit G
VELTHEFSVSTPVEETWAVLTDLQRIAPCMPGFELLEVAGDEYRGAVKVKVGPIVAQYKGVASFRERDAVNHRAVVRAEGRDTRGQGNASATVTATLAPENGGTRVTMHTDLVVTGKVAQFGRGVLADVSGKLLGQFVAALEADLLKAAAGAETGSTGTVVDVPVEPVNLVAAAGWPLLKRVVALVAALGVAIWLLFRCS